MKNETKKNMSSIWKRYEKCYKLQIVRPPPQRGNERMDDRTEQNCIAVPGLTSSEGQSPRLKKFIKGLAFRSERSFLRKVFLHACATSLLWSNLFQRHLLETSFRGHYVFWAKIIYYLDLNLPTTSKLMTSLNKSPPTQGEVNALIKNHVNSSRNWTAPRGMCRVDIGMEKNEDAVRAS